MLIVALGWIYVVAMAAIAEALSPQGTVLGAVFTFLLYGLLPLAVVLYLLGTPARKRALRRAEAANDAANGVAKEAANLVADAGASAPRGDPDRCGHAPGGSAPPVAAKREEA